jgi:hypothetical protein
MDEEKEVWLYEMRWASEGPEPTAYVSYVVKDRDGRPIQRVRFREENLPADPIAFIVRNVQGAELYRTLLEEERRLTWDAATEEPSRERDPGR